MIIKLHLFRTRTSFSGTDIPAPKRGRSVGIRNRPKVTSTPLVPNPNPFALLWGIYHTTPIKMKHSQIKAKIDTLILKQKHTRLSKQLGNSN